MTDLNTQDTAQARSNAYLLLGRLFLRGVTDEVLDHVEAVEPLADELSVFEDDDRSGVDLDEAAAAHQDVFGFQIFPFQSTFLDETARAGGDETRRVSDFFRRAGFPIAQTAESADHLGVELNFLGFLSKMEAENEGEDAQKAQLLTRMFLDKHLLRWLPGLQRALADYGHPFFDAELSPSELSAPIGEQREASDEQQATSDDWLPAAPDILDDPKTGLRDIAEHLLIPAYTGFYLSRADIRGLSRQERLPAGFGSRKIMLTNLLRSAADYDGLQQVTELLAAHVERTRRAWQDFADRTPDIAPPVADPWLDRLDATDDLLTEIRRAAEELA